MPGQHSLEALVRFLHASLHQRGATSAIGSSDDQGHLWMSFTSPAGEIHELHVLAVLEGSRPKLVARLFVAGTQPEVSRQVTAWLQGHGRE